jgi:hypothetical protein
MLATRDAPVEEFRKTVESEVDAPMRNRRRDDSKHEETMTMRTFDERAEYHKRQAANLREAVSKVERPDYCFSNFGDRVDRVVLSPVMAENVDLDKREVALAKGLPVEQRNAPGIKEVPWRSTGLSAPLPRYGADSAAINAGRLNSGSHQPGSDETMQVDDWTDLRAASKAHKAEFAAKYAARVKASGG